MMNYNYIVINTVTKEQEGGSFTTQHAAQVFAAKLVKNEPDIKLIVQKAE